MAEINEKKAFEYGHYADLRKILLGYEQDASRDSDKATLTIAVGALALSITFVAGKATSTSLLPLLYLAWAAFAIAIVLMLKSLSLSYSEALRQRLEVDEHIGALLQDILHPKLWYTPAETRDAAEGKKRWELRRIWRAIKAWWACSRSTMIVGLNKGAIGSLAIGIVFLAIFVGSNIQSNMDLNRGKDRTMAKKHKAAKRTIVEAGRSRRELKKHANPVKDIVIKPKKRKKSD